MVEEKEVKCAQQAIVPFEGEREKNKNDRRAAPCSSGQQWESDQNKAWARTLPPRVVSEGDGVGDIAWTYS